MSLHFWRPPLPGWVASKPLLAGMAALTLLVGVLMTGRLAAGPAPTLALFKQAGANQDAAVALSPLTTSSSPRLDAFAIGADGNLYDEWLQDDGWSGWTSLGPLPTSTPRRSPLAAATVGGSNVVVAFGDRNTNTIWWGEMFNGNWAGWEFFYLISGYSLVNVTLAGQSNGTVDFFATAATSPDSTAPATALFHQQIFPDTRWSGWELVDSGPDLGVFDATPAVTSWGPGRLDLFTSTYANGTLYHKWFDQGAWSPGWAPLEGISGGGSWPGAESVASQEPGLLDLFAIGSGGSLWHNGYTNTNGQWSGWQSRGRAEASGFTPTLSATASWGPGRVDAFALGSSSSTIYHTWYEGGWQGWEQLAPPPFQSLDHLPAVAAWTPVPPSATPIIQGSYQGLMTRRSPSPTTYHSLTLQLLQSGQTLGGTLTVDGVPYTIVSGSIQPQGAFSLRALDASNESISFYGSAATPGQLGGVYSSFESGSWTVTPV